MKNRNLLFLVVLFVSTMVCAQDGIERKVVSQTIPDYPAVLKSAGIGGVVRLTVSVNPDGTVKNILLMGGNEALAECAIASVKKWRYANTGRESTGTVSVTFDPKK